MKVPIRIIYRGILKNMKLYSSINRDMLLLAVKDGSWLSRLHDI